MTNASTEWNEYVDRALAYLPPEIRPLYQAAPDLLEALELAAPYLEEIAKKLSVARNEPSIIDLHERILQARAAIRRARGE